MKYNSHITLFGYVKDGNPPPPKKSTFPETWVVKGRIQNYKNFQKFFLKISSVSDEYRKDKTQKRF